VIAGLVIQFKATRGDIDRTGNFSIGACLRKSIDPDHHEWRGALKPHSKPNGVTENTLEGQRRPKLLGSDPFIAPADPLPLAAVLVCLRTFERSILVDRESDWLFGLVGSLARELNEFVLFFDDLRNELTIVSEDDADLVASAAVYVAVTGDFRDEQLLGGDLFTLRL
jgi:hypothetical protein